MFGYQTHSINVRTSGTRSVVIPRVNTITYGLHSLSYYGRKQWHSFTNTTRSLPIVAAIKKTFVI